MTALRFTATVLFAAAAIILLEYATTSPFGGAL